jgi:hypothetical protein
MSRFFSMLVARSGDHRAERKGRYVQAVLMIILCYSAERFRSLQSTASCLVLCTAIPHLLLFDHRVSAGEE